MRLKLDPDIQRKPDQAGFSMIEMLVVIGIIGILVGYGSVSFVSSLSQSRVSTGIQILNANFKQARQNAISMRQNRRVVIYTEQELDPESGEVIDANTQIWIEGKLCEEYPFDSAAFCLKGGASTPNTYELTDPEKFPDGIIVADVDGIVPGAGSVPTTFYVEFSARGAIAKVYFDGLEADTNYNEIQPVIHLTREGEVFSIGKQNGNYEAMLDEFRKTEWIDPPSDNENETLRDKYEDTKERYKAQTVEIVRLTGKTRTYDYGIMNPWPIDEFIDQD